MPIMNYFITAAESGGALSFDASWLDTLFTIVEKCMGLLVKFPMNLFLAGGLVGIGFAIFRRAKGAAR